MFISADYSDDQRLLEASRTVVALISQNTRLSKFTQALKQLSLGHELSTQGPFTVFAPSDLAFLRQPQEIIERLFEPPYHLHLKDFILYHIIVGRSVRSSEMRNGLALKMANNNTNQVKRKDGRIFLQAIPDIGAMQQYLEEIDLLGSNGVVHQLYRTMTAPWMKKSIYQVLLEKGYTEFVSLIDTVGLGHSLKGLSSSRLGFSVLAPTNSALRAMSMPVKECLMNDGIALDSFVGNHVTRGVASVDDLATHRLYHSIYGTTLSFFKDAENVFVNQGYHIVDRNNLAWNGLVHGVDGFVLPRGARCGSLLAETDNTKSRSGSNTGTFEVSKSGEKEATTMFSVMETGVAYSHFVDLVKQTPSIMAKLSSPNTNMTVFVPSETAFALDNRANIIPCLMNTSKRMEEFLGYHVLPSVALKQDDLKTMAKFVPTLNRRQASIINGYTAKDGSIQINDASVVGDEKVIISGGVIQLCDRLLLFPGFSCP